MKEISSKPRCFICKIVGCNHKNSDTCPRCGSLKEELVVVFNVAMIEFEKLIEENETLKKQLSQNNV